MQVSGIDQVLCSRCMAFLGCYGHGSFYHGFLVYFVKLDFPLLHEKKLIKASMVLTENDQRRTHFVDGRVKNHVFMTLGPR